ncbi:MAG: DUF2764 family protein [Deltaproteobacteria bacterium]|nr:DUF2764 family protein [Deltaproteobacteria bacterium]
MSNYYFLMCLLPPMPTALGEKMSLGFGEIVGIVKRNIHPEHLEVAYAHIQSVDAFNWEQMDQKRDLFLEGGLLSRDDMAGNRELPDFIRAFREEKERGIHRAYLYDRLWELYYSHAHAVAERLGCQFLVDYLSWEIELRSSLAAIRVREKGGNIDDHAILGAVHSRDYSNLITQLKSQKNPLQAERYLDEERLRQIYRFEGSSGFSLDALLAYVTRSALYSRWEKISENFDIETYLWHGGST